MENDTKPDYKRSCALERAVHAYPSFKVLKQISLYVKRTGESKSSLLSIALEQYFERNPEKE